MYWNRFKVCIIGAVGLVMMMMMIVVLFGRKNEFYGVNGITRDIVVKGAHSHNDYWRKRPLIDALSVGCVSVEADVWWDGIDGEVYVGHSALALEKGNTFKGMYVDKIIKILREANRKPLIGNGHRAGVFATDPGQTLFLFVDFKTDGHALYGKIIEEVKELDNEGWLTRYDVDSDSLIWGAVTIIATGNVLIEDVINSRRRVIFGDGDIWGEKVDWRVSPVASGSLRVGIGREVKSELNDEEIGIVCEKISKLHEAKVISRVWDTPGWPVKLRESVWDVLIKCGVDLLNIDDLIAVNEY